MKKRNLYIIIALVLAAGLALSFYNNFTGQSSLGVERGKCTHTDGGDNPETAGIAGYENRIQKYKDKCETTTSEQAKFLNEKYCQDTIETRRYRCETGCMEADGVGYCEVGKAVLEVD